MIRVTGGHLRGRLLKTPPGEITRPALSRVRLAVFNILAPQVPGSRFLDLFGGSGAYAIEALSRGAEQATIVELNRTAARFIQTNIENLGLKEQARLILGDALRVVPALAGHGLKYDIIAVAPPHFAGLVSGALHRLDEYPELLDDAGTVFVQHHRDEPVPASLDNFASGRTYVYGITRVTILSQSSARGLPAQ